MDLGSLVCYSKVGIFLVGFKQSQKIDKANVKNKYFPHKLDNYYWNLFQI